MVFAMSVKLLFYMSVAVCHWVCGTRCNHCAFGTKLYGQGIILPLPKQHAFWTCTAIERPYKRRSSAAAASTPDTKWKQLQQQ